MTQKKSGTTAPRKKKTSKQLVAMAAVVLLVLLYLSTLITALFDNTVSHVLFRASLIGTFTIPLLSWVYIWMYGKLTQKHTIADYELPDKNQIVPQETEAQEENQT